MKILYLDCSMGAAGDMLAAALLELLPDPEAFLNRLNSLGIPHITYCAEPSVKCGITGTHMAVRVHGEEEGEHHHHHHHTGTQDIAAIVQKLPVSASVRQNILAVYDQIAQAESHVHGVPVSEIHFHEVGSMDAVADVTAVCMLMEELAPEQVIASPVHVGSGQVQCAHGILPVPAPATAYLLRDVPIYGGHISGELCTPTGAALLKHFVTAFSDLPVMQVEAIGYGCGKKDFPAANCVRALLGSTQVQTEDVVELSCNLDDMTAEELAFAMERLLEGGALDVFTVPIGMKKSRAATMLVTLCKPDAVQKTVQRIFQHTTTLGVRQQTLHRHVLQRKTQALQTPFGTVHRKDASGFGVMRSKYEYEDLARIAREQNMTLSAVRDWLEENV